MKESDLIVQHRKEWLKDSPGALYYKIPDTMGLGGKRPFDVFIIDSGETIAIEFKIHKTHTAFSLAKIMPHQIKGLQDAKRNGATAMVHIGVRFLMSVKEKKRLNMRVRRISMDLVYDVDEIVDLKARGVKSIDISKDLRGKYGNP